jgi:hypothetical protein
MEVAEPRFESRRIDKATASRIALVRVREPVEVFQETTHAVSSSGELRNWPNATKFKTFCQEGATNPAFSPEKNCIPSLVRCVLHVPARASRLRLRANPTMRRPGFFASLGMTIASHCHAAPYFPRRSIQPRRPVAWPSRLMRMTLCRDGCGWAHASGTSCRVRVVLKLDPRLWGVVGHSTTPTRAATRTRAPRNLRRCAEGRCTRRGKVSVSV